VRRAAHIFLEVCVAGASECVNTSVSADSVLNEATDLFNLLIKSAAVSSSPRLQHVISVRYRAVVSSFSFAVAQSEQEEEQQFFSAAGACVPKEISFSQIIGGLWRRWCTGLWDHY